jgi:hypothetical protein
VPELQPVKKNTLKNYEFLFTRFKYEFGDRELGSVTKVILRHDHLSATQRYLGKVTDLEAIRWSDTLRDRLPA